MKTVLCFGEVLWDLFPGGAELGGAPANFAGRIQSLGHRAVLVSSVGRDALGQRARELLEEHGLDTEFVQNHPSLPTGTVEISVSDKGEPDFNIIAGVAYDEIISSSKLLRASAEADCVCFGTLAQRSPKSRATLHELLGEAQVATKLLDLNLRKNCYTRDTVGRSLDSADILKLNEAEVLEVCRMFDLPAIVPEFASQAIERWALSHCIITRGEEGVYARTASGQECSLTGFRVSVVDTCGSGDAFAAGFMSELFRGEDLERCCAFGNALGALVASTKGGTAPIHQRDVERLLKSR
jgi:fructokinase